MPDLNSDDILSDIEQQEKDAKDLANLVASTPALQCSFSCSEQDPQKCRKCQRLYCPLHASRFSPNFCQECFKNLAIVEDKFSRVFEDYDTKNDKLLIRKEVRTRWFLDGPDWPFLNVWINDLTDDELRVLWVFHHYVMKTIELENETRRVEHVRKLRETHVPRSVSQTTKSTVQRTKTVIIDTPETIRARLKKQGLPESIIEVMIKAMGV